MRTFAPACSLLLMLVLTLNFLQAAEPVGPFQPSDWPWWRGPARTGEAEKGQSPPTTWSENENVLWKTAIPGRGHASPTVVGNAVYLATADEEKETRSVLALDRETGKLLWETIVHAGSPVVPKHIKATQASSTVACDGERLFINFLHDNAMFTTALARDGKILWQTRVTDYIMHQGYGSSPTVYESLCIVSADNKSGGAIAGLDRETGKIVWKYDRPELPNYSSPIIQVVAGKPQLLMSGCDRVTSLNPLTGELLWDVPGATTECVTSMLSDGKSVFTSGGYPVNHVAAHKADGSGEEIWRINTRVYVPSLLIHEGHLYGVVDNGIAICWNAQTGEEVWKGRLRGDFTASPVLVGDVVYATNEAGTTFLFKATPEGFSEIGNNQLGNECFATPTICGNKIYMRIAETDGDQRQEFLICLGEK